VISTRINGFVDWVKGLGLPWWDPASGGDQRNGFYLRRFGSLELEAMWRGDDLIARIIERPAEDMVREGWTIETGDPDVDGDIAAEQGALKVKDHFRQAIEYQRAYGGGATLIGADDKRNLAEELVPSLVDSVHWLQTFEADRLTAWRWDENLSSPTYGQPLIYRLQQTHGVPVDVHRSRLLIFNGRVVSKRHARERSGWGDPVVMRVVEAVEGFKKGWSVGDAIVERFSLPVIRLLDLYSLMETPAGREVAEKRIQALKDAQSVTKMTVLDKEDEYEAVTVNMAGLTDYLNAKGVRVSGAADIPATLLHGQSPAGMDATGDSDIRGYYDRTHARQEVDVRPNLERVTALQLSARGRAGHRFKITFRPLWQPTSAEQATTRKTNAEAAQILFDMGAVTELEVRRSPVTAGFNLDPDETRAMERRKVRQQKRVAAAPAAPSAIPQPTAPSNGAVLNGRAL
jgi:phage-related protein (TIGR01555 family)